MSRCEVWPGYSGGRRVSRVRGIMAGTSVVSFLPECHISVSQEEALANLGGGWERSGLYNLDDTPSQDFLASSPPGVQRNSLNLRTEPPASYVDDGGSESSESVDEEGDLAFTQEPVEWSSPPSSGQLATAGVEGNEGVAKEDSYVAAFESDRSQSPSEDWHGQTEQPGPQIQIPNVGVSAEFLTQPASGVMDFHVELFEDPKNQNLRREAIPEAEFQVLPGSSSPLPPIPENAAGVVEAPVVMMESSLQPFTQPAIESQTLESLNKLQEPASQTQSRGGKNEIVHHTVLLDQQIAGAEEPEPVQRGSRRDEGPFALDNDSGCTGEQMPQESGGDGLSSDSQLLVDDGKDLKSTEHMEQEHRSHIIIEDITYAEVQSGDPGPSNKAQPATPISEVVEVVELGDVRTPSESDQREQMQRSNGDTISSSKALKRVNSADELDGLQKRQRIEASPVRIPSSPKTVMDVVRSRSRSLSDGLVDDECNILSIIMGAGVSFPPFVHEKRSV